MKVTTNAVPIGCCSGNFIGLFFFIGDQAPKYNLGAGKMFFYIGVRVLSIGGIWVLLARKNAARSSANKSEREVMEGHKNGFRDKVDLKNVYFRYVY
jgi:hypothetical protein